MSTQEGVRVIEPRIQDIAAGGGAGKFLISEEVVAKFCAGCDSLPANGGPCTKVGENDQGRYASRKWCGWAAINSVRGEMTSEGFIPFGAPAEE